MLLNHIPKIKSLEILLHFIFNQGPTPTPTPSPSSAPTLSTFTENLIKVAVATPERHSRGTPQLPLEFINPFLPHCPTVF